MASPAKMDEKLSKYFSTIGTVSWLGFLCLMWNGRLSCGNRDSVKDGLIFTLSKCYIHHSLLIGQNSSTAHSRPHLSQTVVVSTVLSVVLFNSFWYCGDCYTGAFFLFPLSQFFKKILVEIESLHCMYRQSPVKTPYIKTSNQ